jgi:hypothetical protein
MGQFDEISAGYNWGNTMAVQYVWPERAKTPGTPEVLVFRRTFKAPTGLSLVLHYEEEDMELVGRISGTRAIVQYGASETVDMLGL